jgi:hypothetical protein
LVKPEVLLLTASLALLLSLVPNADEKKLSLQIIDTPVQGFNLSEWLNNDRLKWLEDEEADNGDSLRSKHLLDNDRDARARVLWNHGV